MKFSTGTNSSANYFRVDPFLYDDKIIAVTNGEYISGSVPRSAIKAIRCEQRSSFKHPIFGFILGAILFGAPIDAMLGYPTRLGYLTLGSCTGTGCMFFLGAYLLWAVVSRRDEPWIVFVLGDGERAFALKHPPSEDALRVLRTLCDSVKIEAGPVPCPKCGYDLRATPNRCPECGTEMKR